MILGSNMQLKTISLCLLLSTVGFAENSTKTIDPLKGLSSKTSSTPDPSKELVPGQVKTLPNIQVPAATNKGFSIEGNEKCAVPQGSMSYSPGQAGYESCMQQMKDNAKTGRDR